MPGTRTRRDRPPPAEAEALEQESVRHDRIADVIESTSIRALYEQLDEFDFSTDESVQKGRP
jgi:hypothetical protein